MKTKFLAQFHVIAFVATASIHQANADSATWNGSAVDELSLWSDVNNWDGPPAAVPGTTNTATFNSAGGNNDVIDLGAGVTISSIIFDSLDVAAYTLGAGGAGAQDLTLEDSGSIIANETVNTNQIFNANLTLGADGSAQSYAITNSVGNPTMSFAGGVSGGTDGIAGAKTLDIDASSGVVFSGIIADGGASSLAIQKSGSGNLTLSGGVSTLTGGINITAGMLTISSSGSANNSTISLGAAGNTGTSVKIGVVNSTTNPSSPLTVVEQTDGEPTTRILSTSANTSGQWSDAITMNDDLTVGALVTNGTNVYSFTLNSGATVNLGSNTLTLQSTSPGNVNANGIISGSGGIIVDCSSTGIAVLGANNDYTGSTTITAGTLQVGNNGGTGSIDNTSSISNSGTLSYRRTGAVNQGGAISGTGLVRVIANGTVTFDKANTYAGTTTISNSGKITVAAGGSIAPTTGAALTLGVSNTGGGTLQYDSSQTSTFGTIKVGNGTGSTSTLNQTAGIINASSLELATTVSDSGQGTVNLSGGAMNISGNVWVGERVNTAANVSGFLNVSSMAELDVTGSLRIGADVGGDTRNGSGIVTQSGGSVTVASGIVMTGNTADATRTRNATYNLDGGTLATSQISKAAQGGGTQTATFNFNGGILKPTAPSLSFMEGLTTASIKDGGAKIDTAGFDITINQPLLQFAGATTDTLTKDGLGTLTLGGTNTYTGATTVNAGTLEVSGSLDATDVEVKNNAALAGTGTLGGNVTVREGGHLDFDVAASAGSQDPLTITGSLTLEANTVIDLTAAAPPAVGGPYVLLTATGGINGTLGSVTFNGVSGSLVKNGNNLELTVTAPTGFAGWAATPAFGLAVADQDPTDDPDNDGLENVLEYVLNGNPSISDSTILPDLDVSGANFVFSFTRRVESTGDTTQVFQYGSDLSGWTPLNITAPTATEVALGTPSDGLQLVTVTIPKTLESLSGILFGRLQVVKIP